MRETPPTFISHLLQSLELQADSLNVNKLTNIGIIYKLRLFAAPLFTLQLFQFQPKIIIIIFSTE